MRFSDFAETNDVEKSGAAAHEVDDLQPVAFRQQRGGPALAADNFAVQLNSNAIGFHPELVHHSRQGKRPPGKLPRFAIDEQTHG